MSRSVAGVAALATWRRGTSDLQPDVLADQEIFTLAEPALYASSAEAADALVQASPGTQARAAAEGKAFLTLDHRQDLVESILKEIQEPPSNRTIGTRLRINSDVPIDVVLANAVSVPVAVDELWSINLPPLPSPTCAMPLRSFGPAGAVFPGVFSEGTRP